MAWLGLGKWGGRVALLVGCVLSFLVAAQVAASWRAPSSTVAAVAAKPAPKPRPSVAAPKPAPVAADAYRVKSILTIKRPFVHGDWYWDDSAAPAAGKIVVTVDLKAQVLSAFRDGHEIGTAVMIYGADVKPTPLGVFTVSFRKAQHVSSIYGAPMPYTLRLTNDGVSIHGSESMRPDAATHGCVGVPIAFARKLFDVVKLGDTVIVSNGETLNKGEVIPAVKA